MTTVPAPSDRPEAPLFADGLGERVVAADGATGDLLQILRLAPALVSVPSFEFALRERAARLANFRHAYYARVRRIDRHATGLAIVSDHVEGTRLSDILRVAYERRLSLDLNAALCLIRQLVPAVALLHENARDVAHGLIAAERVIVTPHARVVIVEHVLGSAVEQLQFTRDRLWQELRVALPSTAGAPRFDHRADVTATGVVALSLVLGRPLHTNEYPHAVPGLLNDARARSAGGEEQPLPPALRNWLARMLQIDPRHGFGSATDAQAALEDALAEDNGFVAAPVALETFLSRYIAALLDPAPAPVPLAPPPVAVAPVPPAAPARPTAPPEPRPVTAAPPPPVLPPRPPAPEPMVMPPVPVARAPEVASAPAAPVQDSRPVTPAPQVFQPPQPTPAALDVPLAPPVPVPVPPTPAPLPIAPPTVAAAPVPPAPHNPPDITELLKDFPGVHQPDEERAAIYEPPATADGGGAKRTTLWKIAAGIAVVGALAGGGYVAMRPGTKAGAAATGTLAVQTNPPGVAVFVDGVAHGNTPARLALSAGSHIVELRGRGVPRVIPVQVTPGAEVSQYLELPETPATGSLLVQSDPAGAQVTIDGVEHGVTPVSVADLSPGEHEVVLTPAGGAPVKQRVVIQAGVTSSVLAPVPTASGPVSGWISVKAPVSIELREHGRLLGTSDADKVMLAAGKHDITFVNETLGYNATRTIVVPAGKVASIPVQLPQGVINLNATPWAEVWIDGARIGETPIGNLPITIGPHEIVFKNPQFGEKHQAVSVTLNAPVRLSVDMK